MTAPTHNPVSYAISTRIMAAAKRTSQRNVRTRVAFLRRPRVMVLFPAHDSIARELVGMKTFSTLPLKIS
jgi:hypothetical protein